MQADWTQARWRSAFRRLRIVGLPLLLGVAASGGAAEIRGIVVSIADGDTFALLDEARTPHRVRLAGINAPEKTQPVGRVLRQSLADLVFHREVTAECGKTDRYGREVCKILHAMEDVNPRQLRAGLAWHYKQYQRQQSSRERQVYAQAEEDARAARRGLWRDPAPVPPWGCRDKASE